MRLGILLIMNRAFPVSASLVRPRGFSAPWRVLLVCILGFALSAMTVKAVAINITVDSTGALLNGTGVANKTEYGQGNNNPTSNLSFLNKEIGFWNGAFNPDLAAAVTPVALNDENFTGSSYIADAGYNYVVFHFGSGQAGGSGGWWQAWYLGGAGYTFALPTVGGQPVGGFSSARFYNRATTSVPDNGSTVLLLGTAVVVLGLASRRMAIR